MQWLLSDKLNGDLEMAANALSVWSTDGGVNFLNKNQDHFNIYNPVKLFKYAETNNLYVTMKIAGIMLDFINLQPYYTYRGLTTTYDFDRSFEVYWKIVNTFTGLRQDITRYIERIVGDKNSPITIHLPILNKILAQIKTYNKDHMRREPTVKARTTKTVTAEDFEKRVNKTDKLLDRTLSMKKQAAKAARFQKFTDELKVLETAITTGHLKPDQAVYTKTTKGYVKTERRKALSQLQKKLGILGKNIPTEYKTKFGNTKVYGGEGESDDEITHLLLNQNALDLTLLLGYIYNGITFTKASSSPTSASNTHVLDVCSIVQLSPTFDYSDLPLAKKYYPALTKKDPTVREFPTNKIDISDFIVRLGMVECDKNKCWINMPLYLLGVALASKAMKYMTSEGGKEVLKSGVRDTGSRSAQSRSISKSSQRTITPTGSPVGPLNNEPIPLRPTSKPK